MLVKIINKIINNVSMLARKVINIRMDLRITLRLKKSKKVMKIHLRV